MPLPGPALARRVGRRVAGSRHPLPHPSPQQESLLEENPEKAFYGSEEDEAKGPGSEEAAASALPARKPYVMDPDHRLLLRNTKPLLQSRSAAVVMAVAQLYFHLAPKAEVGVIAKALVRLLRSHRCVPAPAPPRCSQTLGPSGPLLTFLAHQCTALTPALPSSCWCPAHHPSSPPCTWIAFLMPTCCPLPLPRGRTTSDHPLCSEVQYVVLQNVATMSIKRRVSKCPRPVLPFCGVASVVLGAPWKGWRGWGECLGSVEWWRGDLKCRILRATQRKVW